jgi:putative oxidoreductase
MSSPFCWWLGSQPDCPLGLFGMTLVIQLFVFPSGWPEHILWFSLLGLIIARGPGAISLDHLIWNARPAVHAIAPAAR